MQAQLSTHETLLNRLTDGSDATAWSDFQDRYGDLILGFARRRGVQQADCDDVLQDVLLSLTKAMPEFHYDPARGKFRSFLKTIAIRAVFKKSRQKRLVMDLGNIEETMDGADSDAGAEAPWEKEWRQYHLRIAMQTIDVEFSQADRLAFRHYVVAGMEPGEVAKLLDVTVNQVYKAKSNILKRLHDLIEQQIEQEG